MNGIFDKLSSIEGVTGWAVFDSADQCIAYATPPAIEPILLSKVLSELQEAFNLYRSIEASASLNSFAAKFDEA